MALAPYPGTPTTLHPALVSACTTGNLVRVRQMFSDALAPEPPTVRTSAAQSLLPLAIQHAHPDIVAFCLSHGAQPFFPPRQPGRVAIAFKQLDCYRQLLDAGLDVNVSFGYEGNALITAVLGGDVEVVRWLIDHGAKVKDCSAMLEARLELMAVAGQYSTPEVVRLLVKNGARWEHSLALQLAARKGRVDVVVALVEAGVNVNENPAVVDVMTVCDESSLGPAIHYAAEARHMDVLVALLDRGADATLRDLKGRTILDRAVRDGQRWEALDHLLAERDITII